jgi:hypothetical protein
MGVGDGVDAGGARPSSTTQNNITGRYVHRTALRLGSVLLLTSAPFSGALTSGPRRVMNRGWGIFV